MPHRVHRPAFLIIGRFWMATLAFLTLPFASWPQTQSPSATEVLALPADTVKVYKLSDLCFAYRRTNPDSALLMGQAALRLAHQLKFSRGEAQACNDLAIIHIDRSAYETADSLLLRSLTLRTLLKDSAGMAAVHNKRGIIFQNRFMLEEALEEDLSALRIYERTGPPAHEATILNNIGILQFNLRRLPEALVTHSHAADIRARIGDQAGLAASRGNMANVEAQLGDTTTAMQHLNQAITYFRGQHLLPELAVQLNNLAGIHLQQNNLTEAAKLYAEALTIRTGAGQPKAIASSLIGLGSTRLRQNRTTEAKASLMQGLAVSRDVGARSEQLQALLDLARLHAKLGNSDSSFHYHQEYAALKDSIFNEDLNKRLAVAETRFKTEKKERSIQAQRAEIAELKQRSERRKLWMGATVGAAAMALALALLFFQVHRRRARARHDALIIAERETGLRGILAATEAERKRIASELHDGVGQQITGLRFRLEHIADATAKGRTMHNDSVTEALALADEAGREVRQIAHAMMPKALGDQGLEPALADMLQRALAGMGIQHEFESEGLHARLPPDMETGVYRIAQELVQNTMKHAHAKQVSLQLLMNKGHLVMIYEDDGRGLRHQSDTDGIGLRNIRERAHAMSAQFHLENGTPQGVVATLRVPVV